MVAHEQVGRIMVTEADIVATNCSHCQLHLAEMLASKGVEKQFLHPVQILEMAMK